MKKRTIIHHLRLHKVNKFIETPILFRREFFYMRKHVLEGLYIMQNLQEFITLNNDCLCKISSFLTGDDYFQSKNSIMYD